MPTIDANNTEYALTAERVTSKGQYCFQISPSKNYLYEKIVGLQISFKKYCNHIFIKVSFILFFLSFKKS